MTRNFTNMQIVARDLKQRKRGHEKEILINIGILVVLNALIVFIISLFARSCNHSIEITTQREINIEIVPNNLPLSEKEDLVFESLKKAGFSTAGACGIMGNIAVESPDYDPTAVGVGGGPYGLFQWTNVGRRKKKMQTWCEKHDVSPDSIEGQLAFAIYEIEGGDVIAVRLKDYLKSTDDAYTACAEFAAGFERCIADKNDGCGVYTGSIYPEFYGKPYQGLNKRINKAMNYYERYKDYEENSADNDVEQNGNIINITID